MSTARIQLRSSSLRLPTKKSPEIRPPSFSGCAKGNLPQRGPVLDRRLQTAARRWETNLKGLACEDIAINLDRGDQLKPEYKAQNPQAVVEEKGLQWTSHPVDFLTTSI
jgi:hypothetical protein